MFEYSIGSTRQNSITKFNLLVCYCPRPESALLIDFLIPHVTLGDFEKHITKSSCKLIESFYSNNILIQQPNKGY